MRGQLAKPGGGVSGEPRIIVHRAHEIVEGLQRGVTGEGEIVNNAVHREKLALARADRDTQAEIDAPQLLKSHGYRVEFVESPTNQKLYDFTVDPMMGNMALKGARRFDVMTPRSDAAASLFKNIADKADQGADTVWVDLRRSTLRPPTTSAVQHVMKNHGTRKIATVIFLVR